MKPRCWPLCVVLLVAAAVHAHSEQPQLNDFSMQLPLSVSGANGVVQLRLPLRVYQESLSPDLADVRVFNSAGQALPFTLLADLKDEYVRWREGTARIFPIQGNAAILAQTDFKLRIAADGALLSVRTAQNGSRGTVLSALILDLGPSDANETLDSLQLLRSDSTPYSAKLAIDRSDDLRWWDRIAQSRVDWLRGTQPGEALINDRITIDARSGRYLRIQWLEGSPQVFERIAIRWRSTGTLEPQPFEVKLQPSAGTVAGDWVYATSPSIAATQVGLELPTTNLVLPASIGYYRPSLPPSASRSVPDPFAPVVQGTFYRLLQDGQERTSSNIQIAAGSSAQWVVRPNEPSDAKPLLVLRWYPQRLVFTARGAGNTEQERRRFTLAVGATSIQTQRWVSQRSSPDRVAPGFTAAELAMLEQVVTREWVRGGTTLVPRVAPAAVESWPMKRGLLLWSVLIVGALVLAGMTWRLYKQMQSASSN